MRSIEQGVRNSVGALANLDLEPERPMAGGPDRVLAVTAVIGFEGRYRGLLSLHCPEPLAVRIAAGMLGVTPAGIDDDVCDAIGRVANILGGEVKGLLSPGGRDVAISPPTLLCGDWDWVADPAADSEGVYCSFRHDGERLLVGVKVSRAG